MGVVKELVRSVARSVGVEPRPWPRSDALWRLARLLIAHDVDVVLDVGANDGDFAKAIRLHGYQGRIVSFEPVRDAFRGLLINAEADSRWDAVHVALGAADEEVMINVSGNSATSSSVLPMLGRHVQSAPTSAYVGAEKVRQRRLDDVIGELGIRSTDRVFLKMDVQGYERWVLDGSPNLLASDQLVGVHAELCLVPLYENGTDWRGLVDRLLDTGLTLMSLDPGWTDASTGQMLQADGVFFKV